MKKAVLYARVSTKDQEREGFSIPSQQKLLREYVVSHGIQVVREFVDVETAKTTGRKEFGEMVRFFQTHPDCRTVIVEKTDRLYRNFRDSLTLGDLEVEIHFAKQGLILSKDSRSQDKLVHDVHLVLAKNYSDNLREEVRKGMREKAAQGIYPSRAPFGYRNNRLERTIEIHPENGPMVQRFFELYATGQHSLASLREDLLHKTGRRITKGAIDKILKSRFYIGFFIWEGKSYEGTQPHLISVALFERVQAVFQGHNRPKYRKHGFAFSGLLHCAYDNCMVTAEQKKGRYTYYHCTGHRGKCALPYFREEELGIRLGQVLKDIHVPDDVLAMLGKAFQEDRERSRDWQRQETERLQRRLTGIRNRIDQAYMDKLEGKISEEFWLRKAGEWQQEEQQALIAMNGLQEEEQDRVLSATRILELANKACFLYDRQNPEEQAKLLRIVLSNCTIDDASLYPTYRKPFDLILKAAETKEWWAWADSNCRPPV